MQDFIGTFLAYLIFSILSPFVIVPLLLSIIFVYVDRKLDEKAMDRFSKVVIVTIIVYFVIITALTAVSIRNGTSISNFGPS